jgi:hypothetical protein
MAIKGPTKSHEEIRVWADAHGVIPATVEPSRVDSEPACMCLLHKMTAEETAFVKEMTWEDFFISFDLLNLTVVYDEATVFNEILQVDDKISQPPPYRTVTSHH